MKFVHIADMHFDGPFINLSDKEGLGDLRRLEQRKVFKKVIEYIKENKSNNLIQEKYVYVGPYFCDLYFVPFPDKNWKIGMF